MNQFWQEYFDTDRCRKGTGAVKWEMLGPKFGNENAIPLWVADMDFPTAPGVAEAIVQRAQHGLFGYNKAPANAKTAICDWMQRRHGTHVEPEWIFSSPGVVDSMFHTLLAMTEADDKVLIQGIADCVLDMGEYLVIIDYKTDVISDIGVLKQRYSAQVDLYSAALSRLFGKKAKSSVLYSFYLSKSIEIPAK